MRLGSMTLLVLVGLFVCLFLGLLILFRSRALPSGVLCRRCQRRNRADAKFCARCGAVLKER